MEKDKRKEVITMQQMQCKGYTNDNFIVLDSQGITAFMILSQLLWQDKTCMKLAKIAYNTQKGEITVKTRDFIYKFTNVPLYWDGSIDTHTVCAQYFQELKGVI